MERLFSYIPAILLVGFLSNTALAQYNFDGNYNDCGLATDEWANADSASPNSGSSTCDVTDVYLDVYNDPNDGIDYFIFGMKHGNSGQSNFRVYFNTDCDTNTGEDLAPENLGDPGTIPVGGADYYVNFTTNNNPSATVFEWDGTQFVSSTTGSALTGNSCNASGDFVEVRVPVENVFDPCDNNSCGLIKVTSIISNAGGSANSNYCTGVELTLEIPVNDPPVPDFTISETCDPNAPTLPNGNTLPIVCLDPTGIIDPNFDIGDEVIYEWKYYLNGSTTESTEGTFDNKDNIGGTPITGTTIGDMATCFTPDPTQLPADYTFELTVTDSYDCTKNTEESSVGVTYTVTLNELTNLECRLLPIQLSSFSGEYINDKEAELKWTTASEINNERFEIQRKFDFEQNFITIQTISGAGNSEEPIDYSFLDKGVGYGKVQYRLKQVDFDGAYEYSPIIELQKVIDENRASLYSTGKEFIVEIETANTNFAEKIEIYNSFGQLIELVDLDDNNQKLMQQIFNTEAFARGIFFVNITYKDGRNEVLKSMR